MWSAPKCARFNLTAEKNLLRAPARTRSGCLEAILSGASFSNVDDKLHLWDDHSEDSSCTRLLEHSFSVVKHLRRLNASSPPLHNSAGSVLMLGDSRDRFLVDHLCQCRRSREWIPGGSDINGRNGVLCQLWAGGAVGHFHNFGVGLEPYPAQWLAHLVPGCSATAESGKVLCLRNNSFQRVQHDVTLFRHAVRGRPAADPSLIVVHSDAWEHSKWWIKAGMPKHTHWCDLRHVTAWMPFALAYLKTVQQTFPRATVVWRTDTFPHAHFAAGQFYKASPECVGAMNQAMRHAAPRQGVHVLELDAVFRAFRYDWDGVHPDRNAVTQSDAIWALIYSILHLVEHPSPLLQRVAVAGGVEGRAASIFKLREIQNLVS